MATIWYVRTDGNDGNAGTTNSAGGAFLTPAHAINVAMVGGDTVNIKTGTYQQTAALTPPSGSSGAPSIITGFNINPGDLDGENTFANHPLLQCNNTTAYIFDDLGHSYIHVRNLIGDGGSGASQSARIWNISGNYNTIEGCRAIRFTVFGVSISGGTYFNLRRFHVTNNVSGATVGIYNNYLNGRVEDCLANGLTCPGIRIDAVGGIVDRCFSLNNSGATSDGIISTGIVGARIKNCTIVNNGRDGIRWDAANSADIAAAYNNILYKNGAWGQRSATTTWADLLDDYNFYYNNTSGARSGIPTGAHDVTGTGDPFVNSTATINSISDALAAFALNNTAGAGAACRAAAYPANLDIGVVQHADPAGASMLVQSSLEGGIAS